METSKYYKANLFEKGTPEEIEAMRNVSEKNNQRKVLLRIDQRTHVLVNPSDANPEYAEKLRRRYNIGYTNQAKGGRR